MEAFSWTCETCGKILKHQKSVNRHKKLHTEGLKFPCRECSKLFDRKENLTRHEKICNQKRKTLDRQCSICLKSFKEPWQMKRLMKTHVSKKTALYTNCGNPIKVEDLDSHSIICKLQKPISSEELDEEYPSMIPISR